MNEERKAQFISEKEENVIMPTNIKNVFELAAKREEMLGRDLCEWNSEEIIDFYKYYSTSKIQSLVYIHNRLTEYTNWCISNGLVSDNQNHYVEIKTETLCRCVDMRVLKSEIITREELLDRLNILPNYSDRYIFLGLFEGIPIKNDCLINAKPEDISGNVLRLCDGTTRQISPELKNIMFVASEEECYVSMGKFNNELEYMEGAGKIIRPFKTKRGTQYDMRLAVTSRMRRCSLYLQLPHTMKAKDIVESGRLHYIKGMMQRYNISFEDCINDKRRRDEHEEIYGKIQNALTYISVYGKVFEEQ